MITNLSISNFKSIKSASTALPMFGAIVGKNAAGKTNLLQAVRFLRDLAVGEKSSDAQKRISLIPQELFNFNDNSNNTFTLELGQSGANEEKYSLTVKVGLITTANNTQTLSIVNESLIKKRPDGSNVLIYRRDNDSLIDNDGNVLSVNVDRDTLALYVYKVADTDAARKLFENISIPDMDLFNSSQVPSIGTAVSGNDDLASLIISLRHVKPDAYGNFQEIIRKLLPQFASLIEIASTDKDSYLLVLEESNLKGKLSMQSVSAGDLRTLFLVAKALSMDKNSTLLVEEIENGIHPKRLGDLMERLEKIAMVNELQIIFTTHSPSVINRLPANRIVLVFKSADNGSKYTPLEQVEEITAIKEYLQNGGELTDILSGLEVKLR